MYKFLNGLLMLFVLTGAAFLTISAQTEKRIDEIKQIYKETNAKIAEAEENGEYSSTFLSELVVNKNNGSYPAVGTYKTVVKFYYTFGDREKNPYPDRLLKIEVETKRSDRTETAEFLLNETGQLIFYFGKKDDQEFRAYFSAEKPLKFLKGPESVSLNDKTANQTAKAVLAEKRKLAGIFSASLDF